VLIVGSLHSLHSAKRRPQRRYIPAQAARRVARPNSIDITTGNGRSAVCASVEGRVLCFCGRAGRMAGGSIVWAFMKNHQSSRMESILFMTLFLMGGYSSLVFSADDGSGGSWNAPPRAARRKNPVLADARSVAAGREVYEAQCLDCHGESGKGDGKCAADLNPRPRDLSDPGMACQSDGAIFWKVSTGRRPMPALETMVPEEDRWDVVNYVRTLEPAAATRPSAPDSKVASGLN